MFGLIPMWRLLAALPLPPGATPRAHAEQAETLGIATADQIWLVREHQEARRNLKRRLDWTVRFKLLGPWT